MEKQEKDAITVHILTVNTASCKMHSGLLKFEENGYNFL